MGRQATKRLVKHEKGFQIGKIHLFHGVRKSRQKPHSTLRAKRATFTWRVCGQTVLPDMSLKIKQEMVENAKIEKSNATFCVIFKQSGSLAEYS